MNENNLRSQHHNAEIDNVLRKPLGLTNPTIEFDKGKSFLRHQIFVTYVEHGINP